MNEQVPSNQRDVSASEPTSYVVEGNTYRELIAERDRLRVHLRQKSEQITRLQDGIEKMQQGSAESGASQPPNDGWSALCEAVAKADPVNYRSPTHEPPAARPRATCEGCGFLINPQACKCTLSIHEHGRAGHVFTPMGCECPPYSPAEPPRADQLPSAWIKGHTMHTDAGIEYDEEVVAGSHRPKGDDWHPLYSRPAQPPRADIGKLLQACESLLTMHDRSKAWDDERQALLIRLREVARG
jgi:hypothetical protein